LLLGAGGSYTLTHASNSIGTLAANTGTVSLTDSTNRDGRQHSRRYGERGRNADCDRQFNDCIWREGH